MSVLSVQKIREDATIPVYSKEHQYTIYSAEDIHLEANKPYAIKTGIKVAFPEDHCALIVGNGTLTCIGGLIDSDYRGEIGVLTINSTDISIKKGSAIARMIMLQIALPEFEIDDQISNEESGDAVSTCNDN